MSLGLVTFGVLQSIVYLVFIRFIDLYEREPLRYVIPVFVWGFTVAIAFSFVFNTLFAFTLSSVTSLQVADLLTAVISAPFFEELSKGTAVFIVFVMSYIASRRRGSTEFSGVMDGIVYGSAVGFGFSIAEDIFYYSQYGSETFVVRRIFGGFAHAAFTSLTGIGIGLIPWVRPVALKVLLPFAGLAGAMILHSVFNLAASIFGLLAYAVLFLVLVGYVVIIVAWLAVERRTIRDELREEVASGVIMPADYDLLPTYFARNLRYAGLLASGRFTQLRRERRSHSAAVELALTKRVSRGRWSGIQQARISTLRNEASGRRLPPRPQYHQSGPHV